MTDKLDATASGSANQSADPSLLKSLQRLEARLDRLERYLGLEPLPGDAPVASPSTAAAAPAEPEETGLEVQIGEFWLARVGIIALLVGLGLLLLYPFATLPALVPCLIGYVAVAGLLALAWYWRERYPYLSRILLGGALVLLFFATLRLHFFSRAPVITARPLALGLLVAGLAVHVALAVRARSQFVAGLAVLLACAASLISATTHFALALLLVTAVVSIGLLRRYNWQAQANVAIGLVYFSHLLWLMNNPLLTHQLQAVREPQFNYLYLLGYGIVFAAANCFHYQDSGTRLPRILRSIFNAGGLFVLGNVVGFLFWETRLAVLDLGLHVFFMATATLYWLHRQSRYSTSIYACFGYLALSAAIFAQFAAPYYFIGLAWQSLLVAATAIWFRSKIIVVVNVLIYLGLTLAYLLVGPPHGGVNLSLTLVALITARVLNWQKTRLGIRTELMRNVYLVAATVIVPYGLYHAVPARWVSVSWLTAAIGYFLLSVMMRNIKYRWMAIATVLATAVYAVVVDLARLDPVFRIISFLVLGVVLLVISLFYARHRQRARISNGAVLRS